MNCKQNLWFNSKKLFVLKVLVFGGLIGTEFKFWRKDLGEKSKPHAIRSTF